MMTEESNSQASNDALSAAVRKQALAAIARPNQSPSAASNPFADTPLPEQFGEAATAYANPADLFPKAALPSLIAQYQSLDADGDDAPQSLEDFLTKLAVQSEASQLLGEIEKLDGDAKAGLSDEIAALSAAAKSGKPAGISLDTVRTAIQTAKAEAAASKAETPQQKMDRLWSEIDTLNEKASERVNALPLSDEDKAKHEELKQKVEEAKKIGDTERIKAQKALIEFYEITGIKFNDPELVALAKKNEELVVEAGQSFKQEAQEGRKKIVKEYKAPAVASPDSIAAHKGAKDFPSLKLDVIQASLPSENASPSETGQLVAQAIPVKSKSIENQTTSI